MSNLVIDEDKLREMLKRLYFRLTEQENAGGLEDWDATGVANEVIEELTA